MPSFMLDNRSVISAHNNLVILCSWLRPGWLAYVFGMHVDALRPKATNVVEQREAMLGEFAARHPNELPDGSANPLAGQIVTRDDNGNTMTIFASTDAAAQFREREKRLLDANSEFSVDERITAEHFKQLSDERLPTPKSEHVLPVDFAALMVLVHRPATGPQPVASVPRQRKRA